MSARAILFAAALLAAPAGAAESPFMMPEGSSDFAVGAALAYAEEDVGSARRSAFVQPYFEARWSNGVFMEGLWLGRQLSNTPHLRYGPLLTLGRERTPRPGKDTRLLPLVGAFLSYQLLHNLTLGAHGHHMPGSRGGSVLDVRLTSQNGVAPHHSTGVAAGLRVADRRYLETYSGAAPGASAGVKDAYIAGRWYWELNPKYTAIAGLEYKRLHGSAAAGPRVAKRSSLANSLMLVYRY